MAASRPRAIDSSEVIGIPEGLKIRTRPATAKEKAAERQKSLGREQRRDAQAQRDYAGDRGDRDRDREPSGREREREYGREREYRDQGRGERDYGRERDTGRGGWEGDHAQAREADHSRDRPSSRRESGHSARDAHREEGDYPRSNGYAREPAAAPAPAPARPPSSSGGSRGSGRGSSGAKQTIGIHKPQGEATTLQAPFPALASGLSAEDIKECAFELLVGVAGCRGPALPRPTSFLLARPSKGIVSQEMRAVLDLKPQPPRDPPKDGAAAAAPDDPDFFPLDLIRRQLEIPEANSQRTRKALTKAAAAPTGKRAEAFVVPLELLLELTPADFPNPREYQRWRRRQLMALEEGLLHHPACAWHAAHGASDREGERTAAAERKFRAVLGDVRDGRLDLQGASGKKALREAVVGLAERPVLPGAPKGSDLHWADGYPFCTRLYAVLLGAGFYGPKDGAMVAELEDVLEVLLKVWPVLGITPLVHRTVFGWLFARQYFACGEQNPGLLVASDHQMKVVMEEAQKELTGAQEMAQECHVSLLLAVLPHLVDAGHARLAAYHESFPEGNAGSEGGLEGMAGLVLRSSEVLQSALVQGVVQRMEASGAATFKHGGLVSKSMSATPMERVDGWVRGSVKGAFKKAREAASARLLTYKGSSTAPPLLVLLAADVGVLALDMLDKYCHVLRHWHPNAGGVTAAVLHALYRSELRHFLADRTVLSVEMTQVLLQAEKLEKQLIELAVEECADSEDGGAEVIQEMLPYETSKTIESLLHHWQESRLTKYSEWVERSLQIEKWDPKSSKNFCAPSAVEVLGLLDESQEAFFALPLPPRGEMLISLVRGMEKALMMYCKGTIRPAGSKSDHIPPLPQLTRYKKDSPGDGPDKFPAAAAGPPKNGLKEKVDKLGLARLLVRINTLHHVAHEVEGVAQKIRTAWDTALAPPVPTGLDASASGKESSAGGGSSFWSLSFTKSASVSSCANVPLVPPLPSELLDMFEGVSEEAEKGIRRLCEVAAFRVVYKDLREPLLEGLYAHGLAPKASRLGALLEKLHPHLVTVADVINEKLRNRLVLQLLHALVHGYTRTLLAGGPSRVFLVADAPALKQDLGYLAELFLDGGDGLPKEEVEAAVAPAAEIVELMAKDTDEVIRAFEAAYKEWLKTPAGREAAAAAGGGAGGGGGKGALVMPGVPEKWGPQDANTVLRVLCYRADRKASKYLKKVYDLPKDLPRK